jgi:Ulp1 family protease
MYYDVELNMTDNFFSIRNDRPKIMAVAKCPQQNNSSDCGVYLLLLANYLVCNISSEADWLEDLIDIDVVVNPHTADLFRETKYEELSCMMNK